MNEKYLSADYTDFSFLSATAVSPRFIFEGGTEKNSISPKMHCVFFVHHLATKLIDFTYNLILILIVREIFQSPFSNFGESECLLFLCLLCVKVLGR